MKILQLLCFPLYGSGSGTYVRKLATTLTKLGHEVAIVCPDNRKIPGVKVFEAKLPFLAVFTGHPEHPNAKLYSQLSGAELNDIQGVFRSAIINAVEAFNPDVIHVHHAANLSWIANYIKAVYQIHYVVTSHNTDVINAVLDKRYIPLTQDALSRAEAVITVSKDTRKRLLTIIGKGVKGLMRKTKVIPCGVDTRKFPMKGPVHKVEKKYKLNQKQVVLYSGKITSIKGVDLFVRAATKFPDAIFIVMGDGGETDKMKLLAKEEGSKNIIFTGYLGAQDAELVSELYRRANVVVTPSTLSEGIPMSILEAMSSGTTVVASNIGGIPTIIKHMKNGILVKPKSMSGLVEGIGKVLLNPKLAEKLSKTARSDAVSKYDWKVIAKKNEKYYQVAFEHSRRNRATKKPSFVSEEEYLKEKGIVKSRQKNVRKK